jgi:pimeloyl-ACP methyl ester carboxylesterase
MKHLLLLHGAIGTKDQLQALSKALNKYYHVHSFNFPGHGGNDLPQQFSIALFAAEVVQWLTENKIDRVNIFGYSMGGYVAMYVARHYPGFLDKIVTLGTKYIWTEEIAKKEVTMLNPEVIETKLPKFAGQLQQQHFPQNWKAVLQRTAAMLLAMGKNPPLAEEDFGKITNEVLLLVGDRDKMVSLEETINTYQSLRSGSLCVLPATSHPIEALSIHTVVALLGEFIR